MRISLCARRRCRRKRETEGWLPIARSPSVREQTLICGGLASYEPSDETHAWRANHEWRYALGLFERSRMLGTIKGPRTEYLACHVTPHDRQKLLAIAKQRTGEQQRKVSLSELV